MTQNNTLQRRNSATPYNKKVLIWFNIEPEVKGMFFFYLQYKLSTYNYAQGGGEASKQSFIQGSSEQGPSPFPFYIVFMKEKVTLFIYVASRLKLL